MHLYLHIMNRVPLSARYILSIFITCLGFFSFFRVLFIFVNTAALKGIPGVWSIMAHSMLLGLRFDVVICGYILILPLIALLIAELLGYLRPAALRLTNVFICILFTLALFICSADIPFFKNYNNRLNVSVLNWMDSPAFMARMIWEDKALLSWLLFFIAIAALFIFIANRVCRSFAAGLQPGAGYQPAPIGYRILL